GVVWGLTCWISFGALAAGLLVAVWALFRRGLQWRSVLRDILYLSAGFGAVWLLLLALFPMQPITVFRQAMAAHHFATLESRRSSAWLWLNFFQFWLFCGWPLLTLCAWRALSSFWLRSKPPLADSVAAVSAHKAMPECSAGLFWATVITLTAITLGGSVRGETERLWMLFIAPLCVFASHALVASSGGAPHAEVSAPTGKLTGRARVLAPVLCGAALLFLQALQTLMMAAALAPLVRPI
ncbi:MAG: hypothetical protein JWN98_416, partial [Abditibacteriota bacterium]|nr:hypothetical protein [Abditibacteriota bacterium]